MLWAEAYPNAIFSSKSKKSKNKLLIFPGSIQSISESLYTSFPMLKTQEIRRLQKRSIFAFTFMLFWENVGFIVLLFLIFSKDITMSYQKLTLLFIKRNYTSRVKIYENERRKTMY